MPLGEREVKSVTIAYFSGTGGTKLLAECLEQQFLEKGVSVKPLLIQEKMAGQVEDTDLLLVLSPVYAFRLVSLVEHWIAGLPNVENTPAAVISVSAGGEVSPNTACRVRCKRLLKRKGYLVGYETMVVMPSNFMVKTPPALAEELIRVLPIKGKEIVLHLLSGQENISQPKWQDRCFAILGRAEHLGARLFGRGLYVNENCTQCGLCSKTCPVHNILGEEKISQFGFRCIMCLKCIYQCPVQAMKTKYMRFIVLKDGYNLQKHRKGSLQLEPPAQQTAKVGVVWKGVMDYLQETSAKESSIGATSRKE